MTKQEYFKQGKDLWFEYVRVNGYSFQPNNAGIDGRKDGRRIYESGVMKT